MIYKQEALKEISFPLGGIGTGCIGLSGNGQLIDWEIYNRPDKGSVNGYTNIAVSAKCGDKKVFKILNGDKTNELVGRYGHGYGLGPITKTMCSLPHFSSCEFDGEYPVAKLKFSDAEFPAEITLTAFNPFIPLDSKNSSLPAAFFEISFHNTSDNEMSFQAVFSLANPFPCSRNTASSNKNGSIITLEHANISKDDLKYGQLALACPKCSQYQTYWYRGSWQDSIVMFINDMKSGNLSAREYEDAGSNDTASMASEVIVAPNQTKSVRFVMTWHLPNNNAYWNGDEAYNKVIWKNYYATVFNGAKESADYCLENWNDLYSRTCLYKDTLFASTLDSSVIDAAASSISALRSPAIYRLENGEFYGFEGAYEKSGSCEGTCEHVYNYAYALCFLFPDLERSIRDLEFTHCTMADGQTYFRFILPVGSKQYGRACLDGQMGCVIKTYREWKLSGDDKWLKSVWEKVKLALSYAWSDKNAEAWDFNRDGVLEGRQHHTLDVELFGPSSWLESFYLAALDAAREMAEYLGETEAANEYAKLFEKGKKWTRENLFNGKYFMQKIDLNDKSITDKFDCSEYYWNDESKEIKYQIGEGSSIDQMCGQWHANICGLNRIFDKDQTDIALKNMLKNNFKSSMRNFINPWRVFALNDEAGTVICDYPEGVRKPAIPIAYCEECMTGFEYQFGGLLLSEGFIDEGLRVVKAVRDRYQGYNRNPWNEIECGSNYVRSMAAFALIPIISGFIFDLPHKKIGFNPIVKGDFNCFYSVGTAWGNVSISKKYTEISIKAGNLNIASLELPYIKTISELIIDGNNVEFELKNGCLEFNETVIAKIVKIIY